MQFFKNVYTIYQAIKPAIKEELVDDLYREYPISFYSVLLIASVLFWQLKDVVEKNTIIFWYGIICFILLVRLVLMIWYRHTKKNFSLHTLHYYLFILGAYITAFAWASIGSFLMPKDIIYQFYILIIISGVLAGAVQSLKASYAASVGYVLITLVPILIWEFIQIQQGVKMYIGIFTLMLLYCLYSIIVVYNNYMLLLNNLEMRESLKLQATHDILTGLYNRLYLEEYLNLEVNRIKRKNAELTIMIVDVDHFKLYNDTYGHQMGDAVIKAIGTFLKDNMRLSDLACRYGGDEFIVVLLETSKEIAMSRAEELRTLAKELEIVSGNIKIKGMTLSFGIATYPLHGSTIKEVIEAADKALYHAKELGRDRVCIYQNK